MVPDLPRGLKPNPDAIDSSVSSKPSPDAVMLESIALVCTELRLLSKMVISVIPRTLFSRIFCEIRSCLVNVISLHISLSAMIASYSCTISLRQVLTIEVPSLPSTARLPSALSHRRVHPADLCGLAVVLHLLHLCCTSSFLALPPYDQATSSKY